MSGFEGFDNYVVRRTNEEQLTYEVGKEDPREVILNKVGDTLDKFGDIYGSRIMVATAPTPVKKSALILTDTTRDKQIKEGQYQGKVGLILKMGQTAFRYDPRFPQCSWPKVDDADPESELLSRPKVGDWVYFKASYAFDSGLRVDANTTIPIRYVWDSDVIGVVNDIEVIY